MNLLLSWNNRYDITFGIRSYFYLVALMYGCSLCIARCLSPIFNGILNNTWSYAARVNLFIHKVVVLLSSGLANKVNLLACSRNYLLLSSLVRQFVLTVQADPLGFLTLWPSSSFLYPSIPSNALLGFSCVKNFVYHVRFRFFERA